MVKKDSKWEIIGKDHNGVEKDEQALQYEFEGKEISAEGQVTIIGEKSHRGECQQDWHRLMKDVSIFS